TVGAAGRYGVVLGIRLEHVSQTNLGSEKALREVARREPSRAPEAGKISPDLMGGPEVLDGKEDAAGKGSGAGHPEKQPAAHSVVAEPADELEIEADPLAGSQGGDEGPGQACV